MVRIIRIILPIVLNFVNSLGERWQIRLVDAICNQMPYWVIQSLIAVGLSVFFIYKGWLNQNDLSAFFVALSNLMGLILFTGKKLLIYRLFRRININPN